jgi:hypothetical protein
MLVTVSKPQKKRFTALVGRSPQVLAASLALFRKALGEAAAPFLIDVYASEGNIPALLNAVVENEVQQRMRILFSSFLKLQQNSKRRCSFVKPPW